jgi:SPP1 family predicted phage head-tail adaptor
MEYLEHIEPGHLKQYVTVEGPGSQDTWGSQPEWVFVCNTHAKIDPLAAAEVSSADTYTAQTDYLVTIRWRSDIKADQRLSFTSHGQSYVLLIQSISQNDIAATRFLHLRCKTFLQ